MGSSGMEVRGIQIRLAWCRRTIFQCSAVNYVDVVAWPCSTSCPCSVGLLGTEFLNVAGSIMVTLH